MMTMLIKTSARNLCDFSCFEQILLGGCFVSADVLAVLKVQSVNEYFGKL